MRFRYDLDYWITRILFFLFEYRREKRKQRVLDILEYCAKDSDYIFIKNQRRAYFEPRKQEEEGVEFFRHDGDVTYVSASLSHVSSPWDTDPLSTHPRVASLIYQWKQLEDAISTAVTIPEFVAEESLATKRELEMHIDTLIAHLHDLESHS